MTTGVKVTGGPDIKVRLANLQASVTEIGAQWQDDAVKLARPGAPHRTGTGGGSIHAAGIGRDPRTGGQRAEVRGAFWLIFIDRGTKAHPIATQRYGAAGATRSRRHWITSVQRSGPKTGYGDPKVLTSGYTGKGARGPGGNIFTRKVTKRRQARRPFLTKAAQDAARPPMARDVVIGLWNKKRTKAGYRKLAL